MIYAHIFKARPIGILPSPKKFVLVLSKGFQPTGQESYYDSKAAAKAAAAAAGAKAWNY